MKRRGLLGAAASACSVLAAGCVGASGNEATTESTTTRTPSTTSTATTQSTTTQSTTTQSITYAPPTAEDFAFAARVLEESPEKSPPKVGVELTNVADHGVRVSGGATLPFTNFWSTDGALALVPDDRTNVFPVNGDTLIPASRGECWTLGANVAVESIGISAGLKPAESVSANFSVLASPGDSCPGAGPYRFENDVSDITLSFTVDRTEDGRITAASGTV
jgi:hypothetical protein